jgi:glutaconyl-CoA decarboxylase
MNRREIKMKYVAILNGKKYEVELEKIEEYVPLSRGEAIAQAPQAAAIAPAGSVVQEAAPVTASRSTQQQQAPVDAQPVHASAQGGDNKVLSPMPGNIWEVKVSEGDTVKAGQVLFVLEAMKMENDIVAPVDGVVSSINVKKGDTVDSDATLAILG